MYKQIRCYFVLMCLLLVGLNNANAQLIRRLMGEDSAQLKKPVRFLHLPVVTRGPETSWAFGFITTALFKADRKDSTLRTSNMQVLGVYTLRKQFVAELNGLVVFKKEKYYLRLHHSFSRFPDNFWGVGTNQPLSAKENYSFLQYHINPSLQRRIGKGWFTGLVLDFQHFVDVDYKPGGVFDQQQLVGRNGSIISGLGAMVLLDRRDNFYNPYKGSYLNAYFIHYDRFLGSQHVYTQFVVDARKYFQPRFRHIIALQAYGEYNGPNDVPFRNLARLGGADRMRGYYSGRFTDKAHWAVQAEYRFPIYWRIGGATFVSAGDVANKISKFALKTIKVAAGGGLRFLVNKNDRINLRVDYGFTPEGSTYYFTVTEAF